MLNKNKITVLLLLIFSLLFTVASPEIIFAQTTASTAAPTGTATDLSKLAKYWKSLDYSITLNSNLEAEVVETHTIVFNKRLDGQAFQSLLQSINISNYANLSELKIYEKTSDGKLKEYIQEKTNIKDNDKYYIVGPDADQKIFSVRLFFDAINTEKTFIIKYKLTTPRYSNFIAYYSDYDNIVMSPIPNSTDVFIQNMTMHINLPENVTENDVYFWGIPKSNEYKTEIYANKIIFSGLINKTDTAVGFDMLVKAGIFYIPPDITRKTTKILESKINSYNNSVNTATANENVVRSLSITAGVIVSLIAVVYILKVYLGIKNRKVSTTNKTFKDVDPLKYSNFKPYYTGMILRKKIGKNDLSAMLVDLCIRGYINLRITKSKDYRGRITNLYILDKNSEKVEKDVLSNTEKIFMNNLFKKNNAVFVDSLKESYRLKPSYYYSFISREVLDNKFLIIPPFIHNLSLYKFLAKIVFSLLAIGALLLPESYWFLLLAPLFFVFFTDFLIFETPHGSKMKKDIIAFQDFSLNWKEEFDKDFEKRIPYFIATETLSNVISAISKDVAIEDAGIDWLVLENKTENIEDKMVDKEISIEKEVGKTDEGKNSVDWNDLLEFIEKIRKAFSKK